MSKFTLFVHEAHSWKQQGYFRSRKRFFGKNYTKKFAQLLPTPCLAWGNAITFRSSEVTFPPPSLPTYPVMKKYSSSSTTRLLLSIYHGLNMRNYISLKIKTLKPRKLMSIYLPLANETRDSLLETRDQIHWSFSYSRGLLSKRFASSFFINLQGRQEYLPPLTPPPPPAK